MIWRFIYVHSFIYLFFAQETWELEFYLCLKNAQEPWTLESFIYVHSFIYLFFAQETWELDFYLCLKNAQEPWTLESFIYVYSFVFCSFELAKNAQESWIF